MWKLWLVKIIYYLFFAVIIIFSIIIFLEVVYADFYTSFLGETLLKAIRNLGL